MSKTKTPTGDMRIERQPVRKIKFAAYNPRKDLKPGDPEYQKLKRSIEHFGYVDPLIWNKRTGNLVGGHQRLKVLMAEFGVKEVDVSVVELSPADEKALNVALNKISGEWNDVALAELLAELRDAGDDATLTGFDEKEIENYLATLTREAKSSDTEPKLGGLEYRIIVDCKDEDHQRSLLVRFNKEKLPCRALMS